ncbi:hypothetical protein DL98DRAFT_530850 [Cadophora sp. DSE1049]|nr:hypothetical protein DL98DRAFT_530850 [Cadophora sp. DSE1049]
MPNQVNLDDVMIPLEFELKPELSELLQRAVLAMESIAEGTNSQQTAGAQFNQVMETVLETWVTWEEEQNKLKLARLEGELEIAKSFRDMAMWIGGAAVLVGVVVISLKK